MSGLRLLVDREMPFAERAFAAFGNVTCFDPGDRDGLVRGLRHADALLCRSTIRVDADLLHGTPVRFVATATSGCDHVDSGWLAERGIPFSAASGCNAQSVAEYVFTALLRLCVEDGREVPRSIGIVGAGHVGSAVARIAGAFGMETVLHDPPLADRTGEARYRSLEEALACDVVTVHVPLTASGSYATRRLIGDAAFARMRPGTVFVNTSRGGVLDGAALVRFAHAGKLGAAVLDVHDGEPRFDVSTLPFVRIATPHIAGHSAEGKARGTQMVAEALGAWQGVSVGWNWRDELGPAVLDAGGMAVDEDPLRCADRIARTAYDILRDDADLRAIAPLDNDARAAAFRRLRGTYRVRREFHSTRLLGRLPVATRSVLRALGFVTEDGDARESIAAVDASHGTMPA